MQTASRQLGTVRSWSRTFGFIERDDSGEGLFVHQSDLLMQGYRELTAGQRVEFDIVQSERGLRAVEVEVVE